MRFFILILFFLGQLTLPAQTDIGSIDLPDIIVSSNRISNSFQEENRSVEIITKSDIKNAPVQSIAELLHYAAGVDLRQRGVHGIQADISIRGGGFDQVLILLNGVKLIDPQTGHHSLNLPVSLQNVERIEILRGSGARSYGQNAFAGAINIVTKVAEENHLQVELQGGDFNSGGVKVGINYNKEKIGHLLSWSKDFSGGYRYNTDYQLDNYFYQGKAKLAAHQLNWMAGYTERAFGANGFYASPAFTDQYEAIQTSLIAVDADLQKGNWKIKPRISWRRNQDEYIFVRSNPSIYRNLHISQVVGAEVNATNSNKLGKTGFGVESNFYQLQSNNLGQHQRQQIGAFLEHRFSFIEDRLTFTPGIFINYFSDFDWQFYPGVDFGFAIADNLKIFGDIGLTNRIPTFTDLYYEDPANLGNPNLQPESAFAYDAGLKYVPNSKTVISLAVFQRNGRDIIDWTKENPDAQWQPFNFNQINTKGVEASWRWQPISSSWLKQIKANYTYLFQEAELPETTISRYALAYLRHQVQANISTSPLKNMHWEISGRWLDRVNLENYWVADTRLSYGINKWQAHISINNIFNAKYTETSLVPMPGTWTMVGLKFSLF